MVQIKEVLSKRDLRKFVDFPNVLYRDVPQFVPAFFNDDMDDWNKKKNPALEYCEARCFLAYRDGKIVGRIGAILSHKSNEKWNTKRMRFSQVDFIDDPEVSKALFETVENWARQKGCSQVHGPLGFCDMDREGMLVEGFDKRSMFITYYNHPYYNDHLKALGYDKDIDWLEYKVYAPSLESKEAETIHHIAQHVMEKQQYHVAQLRSKRQYSEYVKKIFELINTAYAPLYGVVDLNEKQINKYASKFIPLINPDYACFVLDKEDHLIAFGVSAPSVAAAMQKCRGHLFPFGFIGVLKALHHNDALDMFLIAVRPDLQRTGINAIILDHMIKNCNKNGIVYAETGPQLEVNTKILAQWRIFRKEQHKRRRCYIKTL